MGDDGGFIFQNRLQVCGSFYYIDTVRVKELDLSHSTAEFYWE